MLEDGGGHGKHGSTSGATATSWSSGIGGNASNNGQGAMTIEGSKARAGLLVVYAQKLKKAGTMISSGGNGTYYSDWYMATRRIRRGFN